MSRSYKKNNISKDNPHGRKYMKRYSNHKIRKAELPSRQRAAYRRVLSSYDIYDYIVYWTKEEAIRDYNNNERLQKLYPTVEDFLSYWEKLVHRK
jgi:hypothetical protein